jgi:hypothetical protein
MSIKISLPDGSVREYPVGVKGIEIAQSISEGLARVSLAIEVNGELWDLSRPIDKDASIKILTWNDKGGKVCLLAFIGSPYGRGIGISLSGCKIWNWSSDREWFLL